MEYEVYTLSSDNSNRFINLICLLESNALYDNTKVNVIPFDEDSPITSYLTRIYDNCSLIEPSEIFDDLGKNLFGSEEYRKGVPCWRLFRKLNFLTQDVNKYKLFLDSNSIFLNSISEVEVPEKDEGLIVFGARSVKGRTLEKIGFDFCNALNEDISDGFNASFMLTDLSFDLNDFEVFFKNKRLKNLISSAPEQGFISIYMALKNIRCTTLTELDYKYRTILSGNKTDFKKHGVIIGEKNSINKRVPLTAKWSGLNNLSPGKARNKYLIKDILLNAIDRLNKHENKDDALNKFIELNIKNFVSENDKD